MCIGNQTRTLRRIIWLLSQLTVGYATPVVSPGSPVCGGDWFYGYQSVGAIYTVADSNEHGAFAIGGYIASDCSKVDTSATSPFDTCAIVEAFDDSNAAVPEASWLLRGYPHSSGASLQIMGLLALSV